MTSSLMLLSSLFCGALLVTVYQQTYHHDYMVLKMVHGTKMEYRVRSLKPLIYKVCDHYRWNQGSYHLELDAQVRIHLQIADDTARVQICTQEGDMSLMLKKV